MKKITQFIPIKQPRKKLLRYGPQKLDQAELIAIILNSGLRGINAVSFARLIIKKFGQQNLAQATVSQLMAIKGLGESKACQIVACFELSRRMKTNRAKEEVLSPKQIYKLCEDFRESKKERFVVFLLNSQNHLIKREVISVGTLSASLVHPREVFEPAIVNNSAHIIIAHNHPSGTLEPSIDDLNITHRIREAGQILDIGLLDHIIVTSESYRSVLV